MAALLHDVVEDTASTRRRSSERFGDDVAQLVDGVTKLDQIKFDSARGGAGRELPQDAARDGARTCASSSSSSPIARTTCARSAAMPLEKQRRIARETLDIYAPIANRLGIYSIKLELEDLGFKTLYP